MLNVDRAPNQAYQSALYAAKDGESKESLMQEMWCREVGTHSMWMPGIKKDKDTNLGLCQDGIKKERLSGIVAFGKGDGLLNSPL